MGSVMLGRRLLLSLGVVSAACRSRSSVETAQPAASDATDTATVRVVVEPAVVGFWLPAADTLPVGPRREAQTDFVQTSRAIARYLEDTDVDFVTTASDTVVVQLAGGRQRVIMLSGLDFPYGYVLIEPGYAEEFHTGVEDVDHLEEAIATYFGLEDPGAESRPRHRIAALFAIRLVYRSSQVPAAPALASRR